MGEKGRVGGGEQDGVKLVKKHNPNSKSDWQATNRSLIKVRKGEISEEPKF
jgi:hypothetical protein